MPKPIDLTPLRATAGGRAVASDDAVRLYKMPPGTTLGQVKTVLEEHDLKDQMVIRTDGGEYYVLESNEFLDADGFAARVEAARQQGSDLRVSVDVPGEGRIEGALAYVDDEPDEGLVAGILGILQFLAGIFTALFDGGDLISAGVKRVGDSFARERHEASKRLSEDRLPTAASVTLRGRPKSLARESVQAAARDGVIGAGELVQMRPRAIDNLRNAMALGPNEPRAVFLALARDLRSRKVGPGVDLEAELKTIWDSVRPFNLRLVRMQRQGNVTPAAVELLRRQAIADIHASWELGTRRKPEVYAAIAEKLKGAQLPPWVDVDALLSSIWYGGNLWEVRDEIASALGGPKETLTARLAAVDADPADGVLSAAELAHLGQPALDAMVKAHGPLIYLDDRTRALLNDEEAPARRKQMLALDRDGDGVLSAQELVDAPGDWRDVLTKQLHSPSDIREPLKLEDLPVVEPEHLKNDSGNIDFVPKLAFRPHNREELQDCLRYASEQGRKVKPRGSLHSFAHNFVTDDITIHPEGLSFVNSITPPEMPGSTLKDGVSTEHLVEVGSGTQLRTLSPILWDRGLALANMGGYNEQTLAGVVNTATHGSGLDFGPFNDAVLSMDMVLASGELVRIERKDGPTDPERFRREYPDMRLIQDDAYFGSASVGMGAMGVVHSYILKARDRFYLDEVRTKSTWSETKKLLQNEGIYKLSTTPDHPEEGKARFPASHVEFLLNPYATHGDHTVITTTRKEVPRPEKGGLSDNNRNIIYRMFHPDYSRPWLSEALLGHIPEVLGEVNKGLVEMMPQHAGGLIDGALGSLEDKGYTERSSNVFNIGNANGVPAISAELAVPVAGDKYLAFVDAFLAKAEEFAKRGLVHTGPVSLRFVKGTKAPLAPQQGDVMMMEIIFVRGTKGAQEMLEAYQQLAIDYGGKPHPGQVNFLSPELMRQMYGDGVDTFTRVRGVLDPDSTFDSAFLREAFGDEDRATRTQARLVQAFNVRDWERAKLIFHEIDARLDSFPRMDMRRAEAQALAELLEKQKIEDAAMRGVVARMVRRLRSVGVRQA